MSATEATMQTRDLRLRAIDGLADTFRSRAKGYDETAAFPAENFHDLRAAGLLALTAPTEYGGDGFWTEGRFAPYYQIVERLAYVDSSTAQLLQVHSHALGYLSRHATKQQLDALLPDILDNGRLLASVGSETNPRAARPGEYISELTPTPTGWNLTCHKFFASLGPAADYLLIWVAVPGQAPYPDRTVTVLVPRTAPTVELIDQWDVLGMRPTVSWSVRVTDHPVPADMVIGEPGAWISNDPRTFTLGFTANHVGSAHAAFDFVCEFVRTRPYMAESEFTQIAIGELAADLFAARSALREAERAWDEGSPNLAEAASLKALHLAKRVLLDTTQRAFDVCGARTAFRDYPLERMYRDARTFTLHFREQVNMRQLGTAILHDQFAVKGGIDSSVLAQRNA